MIPGATKSTQKKLEFNGKRVKVGDRETGVWEVPRTYWYRHGSDYVYLIEGTRLKTTWEFQKDEAGDGAWVRCEIDLENLAVPTSKEHPMRLKRMPWRRLILSALAASAFLVWILSL